MRKIAFLFALILPLSGSLIVYANECSHTESHQLTSGLNNQAIDIKTAKRELQQVFYTSEPPNLASDQILCILDAAIKWYGPAEELAHSLRSISASLDQVESPQQKRQLISHINQNVMLDRGTGYIALPRLSEAQRYQRREIDLNHLLETQGCTQTASKQCRRSLNFATKLWYIAHNVRAWSDQLNQSDKTASVKYQSNLAQQWRSYRQDTIKQWPQEVFLNSLFYRPRKEGLSTPPNSKLLFLRPALGLSYLSDNNPDFQPTLNLDLLGIYWWRYQDNLAGEGRGLAASLVWDGDDTAYGLTYHHNPNWAITLATSNENDVIVSVSFQLAYWLLKN